MPQKTLYRSLQNKQVAGVIGGLAEYLDQDASMLRLVAILVIVFSGFMPGLLAYFIAAAVIPARPEAGTPTDV